MRARFADGPNGLSVVVEAETDGERKNLWLLAREATLHHGCRASYEPAPTPHRVHSVTFAPLAVMRENYYVGGER